MVKCQASNSVGNILYSQINLSAFLPLKVPISHNGEICCGAVIIGIVKKYTLVKVINK